MNNYDQYLNKGYNNDKELCSQISSSMGKQTHKQIILMLIVLSIQILYVHIIIKS